MLYTFTTMLSFSVPVFFGARLRISVAIGRPAARSPWSKSFFSLSGSRAAKAWMCFSKSFGSIWKVLVLLN